MSEEPEKSATDELLAGLAAGGSLQLIVFRVGNEEYGLEIEKVQEVIRVKPIKKLPKSPPFILGVMNLRGNIIPVVGLREKFGMDPLAQTEFTRVIVVNHKNKLNGMVVDMVNQVVNIKYENLESSPEIQGGRSSGLVRGVAKIGDRIIFLVELDYLIYSVQDSALKEP